MTGENQENPRLPVESSEVSSEHVVTKLINKGVVNKKKIGDFKNPTGPVFSPPLSSKK